MTYALALALALGKLDRRGAFYLVGPPPIAVKRRISIDGLCPTNGSLSSRDATAHCASVRDDA
jgi:hypothetical protein